MVWFSWRRGKAGARAPLGDLPLETYACSTLEGIGVSVAHTVATAVIASRCRIHPATGDAELDARGQANIGDATIQAIRITAGNTLVSAILAGCGHATGGACGCGGNATRGLGTARTGLGTSGYRAAATSRAPTRSVISTEPKKCCSWMGR